VNDGTEGDDVFLRAVADHWDDILRLADDERRARLRQLVAGEPGDDPIDTRVELADELLTLLPPDHPVAEVMRTGTMLDEGAEAGTLVASLDHLRGVALGRGVPTPAAEPAGGPASAATSGPAVDPTPAAKPAPDPSALEANVRVLREMLASAGEGDRGRAALLLGLALADLAAALRPDDPRLPDLVDEGGRCLDEVPAATESAATMAAVAGARTTLRNVRPAGAAPPGAAPVSDGAAPADAAGAAAEDPADEGAAPADAAPAPVEAVAPSGPAAAAAGDALSALLGAVGGGGQLGAALPGAGLDAMFPGGPGGAAPTSMAAMEAQLAAMRQMAAMAGPMTGPMAAAMGLSDLTVLIDALAMMLRINRCAEAQRLGRPADWPDPEELEELISALEATEGQSRGGGLLGGGMAEISRPSVAILLATRVQLDLRAGVEHRPPAWFDRTIERLRAAQLNLATSPAFAQVAGPVRANFDTLVAILEHARSAAAARQEAARRPAPLDGQRGTAASDVASASEVESATGADSATGAEDASTAAFSAFAAPGPGVEPEELDDFDRQVRSRLLALPSLSPEELAERGADPANERLIRLPFPGGGDQFPAFQFTTAGPPWDVVARINDSLGARSDPWGVTCWWVDPHARLDAVPADLLGRDQDALLLRACAAMKED